MPKPPPIDPPLYGTLESLPLEQQLAIAHLASNAWMLAGMAMGAIAAARGGVSAIEDSRAVRQTLTRCCRVLRLPTPDETWNGDREPGGPFA